MRTMLSSRFLFVGCMNEGKERRKQTECCPGSDTSEGTAELLKQGWSELATRYIRTHAVTTLEPHLSPSIPTGLAK